MRAALLVLLMLAGCNNTSSPRATVSAEPGAASSPAASSSAPAPNAQNKIRVLPASADSDAISLIRTERLRAKAEGRVLVVYVSATWCDPCKELKKEIEAGDLDERLGKTTLLAFDADKDLDRLGAAGYTFKFVPFVALPGADGRPVDAQQATGHGTGAWKELLGKLDAWQKTAT